MGNRKEGFCLIRVHPRNPWFIPFSGRHHGTVKLVKYGEPDGITLHLLFKIKRATLN